MAASCLQFVGCCCMSLLLAAGVAGAVETSPAPASWTLRDGDRVVLLGDTFIEREGDRAFIETALVASHPDASLTFRNLGWSGDTVWADSRGVFDPPAKGYERMLSLVRELKPTIVFVAYGRNESRGGARGLAGFRSQLGSLCDDLRKAGSGGATDASKQSEVRLVLVTPHHCETADAAARNAEVAIYSQAIREIAAEKNAGLVDLFARLPAVAPGDTPLTENGVHLSNTGYAEAARVFVEAGGGLLPADFAARSAELRRLVAAKNTLFFHRWRPANETYIFLFRKHEQGNNATEMPQFDPLVEEAERKVRTLVKGAR